MKELIEYFDRSYIINLEDRLDRRRQVEQEFLRIGMKIPNETVHFYTAKRFTEKGNFPDIGTRGNFTSHKEILRLANLDRLRNLLVFEDDVSFRRIDPAIVTQIVKRLDAEEWDVAYFGYLSPSDDALTGPLVAWPADVLGAHFYAVNGPFIVPMHQYMSKCELLPPGHPEGGPITADGAYNHVRYVTPNVRVLLSVPSLAHQRSSRTDLHPLSIFDRLLWLRPMLQQVRAVKHSLRMLADRNRLRRR